MPRKEIILVSSCIAGLCTRYDNKTIVNSAYLNKLKETIWIPVCPEQLGGLPTPRMAADLVGGNGRDVLRGRAKVVCRDGTDVTEAFINGAHQVLDIACRQSVRTALLKARSPSCGVSKLGVTAALLQEHGIILEELD